MMPARQNTSLVSLQYLLKGLASVGSDLFVENMELDARKIQENDVFIAVAGSQAHGLEYAEQAIQAGAVAIIYDPASGGNFLAERIKKQQRIELIELADLTAHISTIAARLYQHPSRELSVVGITGTNGKTSVSHYIAQALDAKNSKRQPMSAVIGTLGWGPIGQLQETINTTPDAISVQRQLSTLLTEGVETVAMEVSSHGLDQGRVSAVDFKGAVFTNLSHDHLDYHQTIEAYGEAKLSLFKSPSLEFVVLNKDDEFSARIVQSLSERVRVYSFSRSEKLFEAENCWLISNEQLTSTGLMFDLSFNGQAARVQSALFGAFNIDNLVATMAVLTALGDSFDEAVSKVASINGVSGRMQQVAKNELSPTVVVDYAHTPEALRLALLSLRQHCEGLLTVIFGCGGNRDEAKRPLMGAIAADLADSVVLTSDNPRFESAVDIAEQIKQGMPNGTECKVILDRAEAIQQTIAAAERSDIVLLAGKGHENYQQIQANKIKFSDVAQAQEVLKARLMSNAGGDGCKR